MSRTLGPTVEILMRRVRQEGGLAVDPDFAISIYTLCTQIINTHTRRIITSDTLTVPKQRLLFPYRDSGEGISDAVDILEVRKSGVRIEPFNTLGMLSAYDPDWFRKVDGTAFEAWCQISRDILILYPGQVAASSVDVTYVKLLTHYEDFTAYYNTENELPDEDVEIALKLSEIILLSRLRQYGDTTKAVENFLKTIKGRKYDTDRN